MANWSKLAQKAIVKSASKAISELDPELVEIKPVFDYYRKVYQTIIPPGAEKMYSRLSKKDIGIPLTDPIDWEGIINQFLASAPMASRIVGVTNNTKQWIADIIVRGLQDGLSNEQIQRQIREGFPMSRRRALTISRTETGTASMTADYVGAQQLALEGYPVKKTWLATMDSRTRDSHSYMNGQTVGINEYFNVNGFRMSRPLDPGGPASEVINCRCTMTYSL